MKEEKRMLNIQTNKRVPAIDMTYLETNVNSLDE